MIQRKITIYSLLLTSLSAFAQITDPKATEIWEPQPRVVTPGVSSAAPSDAIVIFDGKDLTNFSSLDGSPAKWEAKDGIFTVVKGTGDIKTKQAFGSIQLHIEWRTPAVVEGDGQGRGNSGIFLMERYELQVLDNYNNKTYANGQAGSIYKQTPPLVNACKKPGEWQVYDVVFSAPKFNKDGQIIVPARITAFQNGILIQNNTEIKGPSEYIGLPVYKAHDKASIKLQDHGNPTSYRNIWIREIE